MESANKSKTSSSSSSALSSSADHLQTAPASTSGFLEIDVGNGVATPENGPATTPPHTGSLLTASYYDEDFQGGSTPRAEQPSGELSLGNDSVTQSPPTQVMERPGDPGTPYRIPDHVFARKPSTAPAEWSAASNDSLFSIQMGNMSFTREQFAFLGKSGELGLPGELNMPGTYIDFSSNEPPDRQVEISQNGVKLDETHESPTASPRVTEAKAVETMREVLLESAENDKKAGPSIQGENHRRGNPSSPPSPVHKGTPPPRGQNQTASPSLTDNKFHTSSDLSRASDGSTKSFAFPILAGSEDRSNSAKIDGVGKHKQNSPRGQAPQKQLSSQIDSRQVTPKASSASDAAAPQTPKADPVVVKHKCLPCFSCCSFCN